MPDLGFACCGHCRHLPNEVGEGHSIACQVPGCRDGRIRGCRFEHLHIRVLRRAQVDRGLVLVPCRCGRSQIPGTAPCEVTK